MPPERLPFSSPASMQDGTSPISRLLLTFVGRAVVLPIEHRFGASPLLLATDHGTMPVELKVGSVYAPGLLWNPSKRAFWRLRSSNFSDVSVMESAMMEILPSTS